MNIQWRRPRRKDQSGKAQKVSKRRKSQPCQRAQRSDIESQEMSIRVAYSVISNIRSTISRKEFGVKGGKG